MMVALAACSSNTPESTAKKFLEGFYHMDYEKAREVSTEETKNLVDLVEQFSVSYPDSAKQDARNIKIDIVDVKEDGDKATVTYKTSSEPGEQKLEMIKENGKWLASFSKQDTIDDEAELQEEMITEETETTTTDSTAAE